MLKEIAKILVGSRAAREKFRKAGLDADDIASSLRVLPPILEDVNQPQQPIFILSAGWRSGSTLLQRLVMSDPEVLVWGEIYDHCALVQALARSVTPISESWPPTSYLEQPDACDRLSNQWTANMYPPLADLSAAYRAMLNRLLQLPAQNLGRERWGMKEVRFGEQEARFIRWLYPDAKLLFIYRNPYDAFRSYKSFSPSRDWFARWPDEPAFTAAAFGRHWAKLTSDFLTHADELKGFLVRYEDLVTGQLNLEALQAYCDIKVDRKILEVKVGGSASGAIHKLSWLEENILRAKVNKTASPLGYRA